MEFLPVEWSDQKGALRKKIPQLMEETRVAFIGAAFHIYRGHAFTAYWPPTAMVSISCERHHQNKSAPHTPPPPNHWLRLLIGHFWNHTNVGIWVLIMFVVAFCISFWSEIMRLRIFSNTIKMMFTPVVIRWLPKSANAHGWIRRTTIPGHFKQSHSDFNNIQYKHNNLHSLFTKSGTQLALNWSTGPLCVDC